MKVRVSHFSTKNIEITNLTRPVPQKVTTASNTSLKKNESNTRQSLAKKLNLDNVFCTYKVEKSTKTTPVSTPKKRENIGVTKANIERKAISVEARYAAQPRAQTSTVINNLIQLEASVFRSLADNGGSEMEDGIPGGWGPNPEGIKGFW